MLASIFRGPGHFPKNGFVLRIKKKNELFFKNPNFGGHFGTPKNPASNAEIRDFRGQVSGVYIRSATLSLLLLPMFVVW